MRPLLLLCALGALACQDAGPEVETLTGTWAGALVEEPVAIALRMQLVQEPDGQVWGQATFTHWQGTKTYLVHGKVLGHRVHLRVGEPGTEWHLFGELLVPSIMVVQVGEGGRAQVLERAP